MNNPYKSVMATEARRRAKFWESAAWQSETVIRCCDRFPKSKEELELHQEVSASCRKLAEFLRNSAK